MAQMTGILTLKLDSQVFETESGSIEVDFGGEVQKTKPSPSTGRTNRYSELMIGKVTVTLHHTKACDVEFLRNFKDGEVVIECKDTKKQWQSKMSLAESCKLQDQGRGMPLVLEGDPFTQTKEG